MYIDLRKLNAITPQIRGWISKDFYQVGMDEKFKQYTAFVCPLGHFQFRRMPFGLKNAPNVFQDLVSKVLAGCSEYRRYLSLFGYLVRSPWSSRKCAECARQGRPYH